MATFRVKTNLGHNYTWSNASKEQSDTELIQSMLKILDEMSKDYPEDYPESQSIRVQALDRGSLFI